MKLHRHLCSSSTVAILTKEIPAFYALPASWVSHANAINVRCLAKHATVLETLAIRAKASVRIVEVRR